MKGIDGHKYTDVPQRDPGDGRHLRPVAQPVNRYCCFCPSRVTTFGRLSGAPPRRAIISDQGRYNMGRPPVTGTIAPDM